MDKDKIDLTKPAFGPEAQTLESLVEESKVSPAEVSQPKEEAKEEEAQSEESVEEQRVPYSRFEKYHKKANEYEQKYHDLEAKYEELTKPRAEKVESELPDYWVKLYGDSPEATEAWKVQQNLNQQIREEAREYALNAVKEESQKESRMTAENLETIDSRLEQVSEIIGRQLTEKEESALLDIVDEFTPKDRDGNYVGETIPFDKAWEIYEMKQNSLNAPKKESRNKVASLSSQSSQGETNVSSDKEKDFNPFAWGAWKGRL